MTSEPDANTERTELIDHVQRSWDGLRATVDGLDDRLLASPGPDGWTVADHLVHVERWAAYLVAELEGRDGRPELSVAEGERPDTDAINDRLRQRHAGVPAAEARRRLAETHERVVAVLGTVDAATLQRRRETIAGNTYEHYDEHDGWIRSHAAASTD
jgi:hypothetical protein